VALIRTGDLFDDLRGGLDDIEGMLGSVEAGDMSVDDYVKLGVDGINAIQGMIGTFSGDWAKKERYARELAKAEEAKLKAMQLGLYGPNQGAGMDTTTILAIGGAALVGLYLVARR